MINAHYKKLSLQNYYYYFFSTKYIMFTTLYTRIYIQLNNVDNKNVQ